MSSQLTEQAVLVTGVAKNKSQQTTKLSLFDEDGNPVVIVSKVDFDDLVDRVEALETAP